MIRNVFIMLMKLAASGSVVVCLNVSWVFFNLLLLHVALAQKNGSQATTAPNEGQLLSSIFFLAVKMIF